MNRRSKTPDGRVVFTSMPGDLFIRSLSGAGEPEIVVKNANLKHPNDWSADGRFIVYDEHHPTARQDLWVLPLAGDRKPPTADSW